MITEVPVVWTTANSACFASHSPFLPHLHRKDEELVELVPAPPEEFVTLTPVHEEDCW